MTKSLKQMLEITKKGLNQEVVNYLKDRGIKRKSAEDWELGYLPDQKLLQELDDGTLQELGILVKGKYSPLHQYLTFPLYDQYNNLIGFSGRTLIPGQKKRKYWHSIIAKRRYLFGLNHAIQGIREKGYAIVGEGQFDVITAHQLGLNNVVCSMGTALTPDQVTILARYTNTIYVVFDNDQAGQRALETQSSRHETIEGIKLIPVVLPEQGADIDSYLRTHGKEQFLAILAEAVQKDSDV